MYESYTNEGPKRVPCSIQFAYIDAPHVLRYSAMAVWFSSRAKSSAVLPD